MLPTWVGSRAHSQLSSGGRGAGLSHPTVLRLDHRGQRQQTMAPTNCIDKQQLINSARRRPDSNRGEGAVAARLAILSPYPPNGGRPGCGVYGGSQGPVGQAGCCPLARSKKRQDSGNYRGGFLVIPSSLLRASAVCYVRVTAVPWVRLRSAQILRRGQTAPSWSAASVHLSLGCEL